MPITSFTKKYRFLSNLADSPVEYQGVIYPSVENAFQAAKTPFAGERGFIRKLSAFHAKRAGLSVTLRYDWEDVKVEIMAQLIHDKFERNEHLRKLLLETGEEGLVEGNRWGDDYWGVCSEKGLNILGRLLMRGRDAIRRGL